MWQFTIRAEMKESEILICNYNFSEEDKEKIHSFIAGILKAIH